MTPHNSQFSPPFLIDLNEDQPQHLFFFSKPEEASASSSSSLHYPNLFNPPQEEPGEVGAPYNHGHPQLSRRHEEENTCTPLAGSSDNQAIKIDNNIGLKLIFGKREDRSEARSDNSSVKWMPSKMRLMKKMISDQTTESSMIQKYEDQKGGRTLSSSSSPSPTDNISSNNAVRVCADCNTTKTPLWRSGPRGPKSLCNACGIRQRKARRAMAAAAASGNGMNCAANPPAIKTKVQHKKTSTNSHLPFKKRCKFTAQTQGRKAKLGFEDLTMILSKNSAYQQVFPQDEKEAAILLMALSYGLVHG